MPALFPTADMDGLSTFKHNFFTRIGHWDLFPFGG